MAYWNNIKSNRMWSSAKFKVLYCTVLFGLFVSGAYELWNKKTHTHTHLFNGPLSGTTRMGRCQKGKTNLDFTEARYSEWQWHQLGRMQVCTSLQADNHASIPTSQFFYRPDALSATQPTVSKHWRHFEFNLLFFEMRRVDWIFLNIWCTRITVIGWSSVWQMRWKETWRVS